MRLVIDRRFFRLTLKIFLLASGVLATVTFMLYAPVQPTWQTVTVDSLTEPESMFGGNPPPKLRKSLESVENSVTLNFEPTAVPINPHPFQFTLLETEICTKTRPDLFILAVVHTAPKNYKRRMLIRETWGSQRLYKEVKTVVIFTMGLTKDLQVTKIFKIFRLKNYKFQITKY